jgi:hypothetical protein
MAKLPNPYAQFQCKELRIITLNLTDHHRTLLHSVHNIIGTQQATCGLLVHAFCTWLEENDCDYPSEENQIKYEQRLLECADFIANRHIVTRTDTGAIVTVPRHVTPTQNAGQPVALGNPIGSGNGPVTHEPGKSKDTTKNKSSKAGKSRRRA